MHFFFFFNDTATTEIYTLSLHDALPISHVAARQEIHLAPEDGGVGQVTDRDEDAVRARSERRDRKSTRLNSSHLVISYAVFCLKKKKNNSLTDRTPQVTVTLSSSLYTSV